MERIPMDRTSTRAVTLGDHLIHDTYVSSKERGHELVTACHNPAAISDILNPLAQPLRITCAYCINELRSKDRLAEIIDADPQDRPALEERHQQERKLRAKPLGPLRAWASFNRILREAGLR